MRSLPVLDFERRPETHPLVFRQAVEMQLTINQMSFRTSTPQEIAEGTAYERAIIVAETRNQAATK